MRKMGIIMSLLGSVACGSLNRHRAEGGVTVEARITFQYPEARRCFDDPRIESFDQLRVCLELVTNKTWTVAANGDLVELIKVAGDIDNVSSNPEE